MKNVVEGLAKLHFFQDHRLASFKKWPFSEKNNCNVVKMAEAGFYWNGTEKEADTAICFVCGKELDGWEPDDDPWQEHRKHAPQCAFVKLGKVEEDLTVEEVIDLFEVVMKFKLQQDLAERKAAAKQWSEQQRKTIH